MTRRVRFVAWTAAAATYCLIVLGAVVRITGSGLGCGNDWPVCHGHLFPSFSDINTLIEWNHRLVAAIVSTLVATLAVVTWWERRGAATLKPSRAGYVALFLLALQVLLGAVTVKLDLPPWTVILHLGTAMLLLATLLVAALGTPDIRPGSPNPPGVRPGLLGAAIALVTVLFGGLTANLGAATACVGFPLCNGQIIPDGNYLQHIQWTHRLLAYGLFVYLLVWAWRSRRRGAFAALGVASLQIGIAAAMVLLTLPRALQAAHAAVGAAVWATLVIIAIRENREVSSAAGP
jgi:heme a synthase